MKTIKNVEDLVGETITKINGGFVGSEEIEFVLQERESHFLYYEHDCCASCDVNDIIGNLDDLLNTPLLMAEEVDGTIPDQDPNNDESYTWTFYKFATIKGYVTIRWYGSSNGYYSESVSFR